MQITEIINSIPEFMWNNIFSVISTLGCGLIVAFFTSTFLKKKEERTRIAGVIVEKRINSERKFPQIIRKLKIIIFFTIIHGTFTAIRVHKKEQYGKATEIRL